MNGCSISFINIGFIGHVARYLPLQPMFMGERVRQDISTHSEHNYIN